MLPIMEIGDYPDIAPISKRQALEEHSRHHQHRHVHLGYQPALSRTDVKHEVRAFAKRQFGQNYQYLMALHIDTDSPHVHQTVENLGYDGYRLNVKKGDPKNMPL